MDLFKRIQDLSAIYDDDGPSATVPESRPMFNERTQFDKGGVAKVKEYVQSLPKNTVVTRKLIQDFIDSNDVNVNFQNLFTKNRPAYVGNFTKDKSITIDSSYPTGSKRYKKAKAIINDPKLKKEFIKFGNQKGISINDIREKFNIGREEFYEGGLRELFDKDFQLQQASKLKPKTINNITTLLNDKEASSFLKKGQVVPDEILTKLKIAPSEAATATVRIGQIYGGNKFDEKAFKNIRTNVKASDNLFNTMNKFAFGNPYRSKLYNASLELIDEQLGNEKGTFASLKKKASYILKKNKIKGFDINEIAGVSGTAKSGAGEFSQFIDVMDSNLNQKQMASFQSAFSQARQNIANNPNNFEAESKRINKLASRFEREYGVKLPRIRDVGDVEKYYSANRLKNLSDQGLDIKKASKNVGYTIQMPKGAKTITEFTELKPVQIKGIAKKLADSGFECRLANGINCNDPRAYTQSIKENMAKVQQGDNASVAKVNKLGKAMNGFKGAAKFTGWGLLTELGFSAPLAAVDYAKGANKDEIISNATYGLFGKSEEEQLKEKYADYGQAQKFQDTYDKLLNQESALDDQTGYGPIINPQNIENTEKKLIEQSKPFNTILPPSMGFKGDFDLDMFFNAQALDQKRREEFAKEKEQRSKEIGILKPSTGLEAVELAGGGIAKMAGDRSGPPPVSGPNPQGLLSLMKRARNY
mgnify:FL=1